MTSTSASRFRLRSVVGTAAVTVVLAAVGVGGTARAEDPAPAGAPAAAPADEVPVDVPTAPVPAEPTPAGEVAVSAVVVDGQGADVVTVEVAPSAVARTAAALRAEPGVVSVSVDTPVYATAADPRLPEQWGYYDLNLDRVPAGVASGSGERVAVIDTGVLASHPDLTGRVRCDLGADFVGDGFTTSSGGNGCIDPNGHGTHVAGTIGAVSDNGIGVAGVSAAQIIPIRVLGANGSGWSSDIADAVIYAVDAGASVINMSLGGYANTAYDAAVTYALDHDVVVVASAGNNRFDGNATSYPGGTPGVFSVAASDDAGVSAGYSHSGPTNFITAPGSSVLSTSATDPSGYQSMSGTSMAAPHAAGVIARYRALYPSKTVAEVRAAVQATAIDIEAPGKDNNTGYGLIDAFELLTGQQSPARTRVTAPGEPTGLRVSAGNRAVTASWGAPSFTGGSAVAGYVLQAVSSGHETEVWLGAAARSATVPNLVNGAAYRVYVTAYNSTWFGNPAFGAPVTPRAPTVPGAPAIGAPTAGNAAALVRWSAAAANGSAVSSYTVKAYRGSTLVKTVTASGNATSLLVTGLANGAGHTFTVTARNGVGYGPTSARSAAAVPKTRPSAPGIGRPSAANGAAVVRWAPPASNGGSAVSSFTVRAYRGATLVKTVTVSGSARGVTVNGLTNRVGYGFTVTANNAVGAGPSSARSATVVPRR
jgi:subtilisin family serine protease